MKLAKRFWVMVGLAALLLLTPCRSLMALSADDAHGCCQRESQESAGHGSGSCQALCAAAETKALPSARGPAGFSGDGVVAGLTVDSPPVVFETTPSVPRPRDSRPLLYLQHSSLLI
jgi:hypothetical protein